MPREEGFPMKSLVLPIMAALALSVVACRQEGAAERAGAKIDEAIEDTREAGGEALEDAGEAVEETAEEAAEKARKAVE
jgi:hypothetical protein